MLSFDDDSVLANSWIGEHGVVHDLIHGTEAHEKRATMDTGVSDRINIQEASLSNSLARTE